MLKIRDYLIARDLQDRAVEASQALLNSTPLKISLTIKGIEIDVDLVNGELSYDGIVINIDTDLSTAIQSYLLNSPNLIDAYVTTAALDASVEINNAARRIFGDPTDPTIPPDTPPDLTLYPPVLVSVTESGGALTANFTDSTVGLTGTAGHFVFAGPTSPPPYLTYISDENILSYTVPPEDITPGEPWYFQIETYLIDDGNPSSYSGKSNTLPGVVPVGGISVPDGIPVLSGLLVLSPTSISFVILDNASDEDSIVIEVSVDNVNFVEYSPLLNADATLATLVGLLPNTLQYFRAKNRNTGGDSVASNVVSGTTSASAPVGDTVTISGSFTAVTNPGFLAEETYDYSARGLGNGDVIPFGSGEKWDQNPSVWHDPVTISTDEVLPWRTYSGKVVKKGVLKSLSGAKNQDSLFVSFWGRPNQKVSEQPSAPIYDGNGNITNLGTGAGEHTPVANTSTKIARIWDDLSGTGGRLSWTLKHKTFQTANENSSYAGDKHSDYDGGRWSADTYSQGLAGLDANKWHRFELYVNRITRTAIFSVPSEGKSLTITEWDAASAGKSFLYYMGWDSSSSSHFADDFNWFNGDVQVQRQNARVLLSNSATFNPESTYAILQETISRASGSIDFAKNLGDLDQTHTIYALVVAEDNTLEASIPDTAWT